MFTPPTPKDCKLEVHGRVALLTFMRHDVRNAVSGTELIPDLIRVVEWVNLNREISVLVITGDGTAFSSGGNIKEMQKGEGVFGGGALEILERYHHDIHRLPLAMESCEVPVIAAVNGPAMGVGFDLVCMCDLRIAGDKATVGEVFINLGLIPGDGGAWFLPRVVGAQRAAELTYTGRVLDARQALEYGVFLEVVEQGLLMARALGLAQAIAAKSPQAVRMAKRLMRMGRDARLEHVLSLSGGYNSMLHATPEHKAAVNRMLQKPEKKKVKNLDITE